MQIGQLARLRRITQSDCPTLSEISSALETKKMPGKIHSLFGNSVQLCKPNASPFVSASLLSALCVPLISATSAA